ncbi:MAG TPA: Na+/H+ antiporter subunit E [Gammaproteobacteria bacterium]|nr:Na+/H+ antiporter subunit E [Gammaproteobacteria bacterium]
MRFARPPLVLALALLGIWLLLYQTLTPGIVALGAVLALLVSWTSTTLRPARPKIRQWHVAFGLLFLVLADIVRSNLAVARIVLGLERGRAVRSGFIEIPLDLRDPHGLAVLAAIVTATPGTVWAELSPSGGTLTLHMLDIGDEDAWIRWFKERYERRLMRVFE